MHLIQQNAIPERTLVNTYLVGPQYLPEIFYFEVCHTTQPLFSSAYFHVTTEQSQSFSSITIFWLEKPAVCLKKTTWYQQFLFLFYSIKWFPSREKAKTTTSRKFAPETLETDVLGDNGETTAIKEETIPASGKNHVKTSKKPTITHKLEMKVTFEKLDLKRWILKSKVFFEQILSE